jgi:K(+)-stimulated pyrophosphate-energized sodium pump
MNILIKLMSIVSLVIAPSLASLFAEDIQANRKEKIETMMDACKKAGCEDEGCCSTSADETTDTGNLPASTVASNAVIPGVLQDGDFLADVGEMTNLTLPDGNILKVGMNSVEKKLVDFITNGTINTDDKTKDWFSFDRIQFESGNEQLKPGSDAQIKNLAAILEAFPQVELKLGGYTDNTGDAQSNLTLSEKRAKRVMTALVAQGIAFTRLKAEGYGQEFPVGDNTTELGRAMNRRIDVRVTKK